MNSILVTGGTGFIGSAITNFLALKKYKVVVFDNNSRGKLSNIKKLKNINFIKGDIRNYLDLLKASKNIDTIIHLAAVNGTKYFYTKPEEVLEVAVKGIVNIIDVCKKRKIKNLFLASSSEVYNIPKKVPTNESEEIKIPDVKNSRFSYSGGKIITELMGVNFGKKYFDKLIIFRPHNVFGKNMGNEHVIPEFINKIKKIKNNTLEIQGTGNEERSFIHIDDFIKAFEVLFTKGKHMEIYHIGTSEMVTIKKLSFYIASILNKKINLTYKKRLKGSTTIRCPDIKKIRKLGFKPQISLYEGLKKVIF
jgi:nucleoside-diphosphate-sugar epimerase